jgi:hypothetical protein
MGNEIVYSTSHQPEYFYDVATKDYQIHRIYFDHLGEKHVNGNIEAQSIPTSLILSAALWSRYASWFSQKLSRSPSSPASAHKPRLVQGGSAVSDHALNTTNAKGV